ncbi:MAG: hypothetical protein WD691_07595 [Acidimicrobiales bacterium]
MTFKQFLDRYGVSLGVVFALALVIAILPGNSTERAGLDTGNGGSGGFDGGPGSTDGTLGSDGGAAAGADGGTDASTGDFSGTGTTGGSASATGGGNTSSSDGTVQFGAGPDCGANGRQKGISAYMPPCVQWTGTDNGGATARGVTREKILIISWLGQEDPATRQALTAARLNDDPGRVKRAYDALFKYGNQHFQTYGREVVFEEMQASGPSTSDEAMIADAVKIADERKAFAVFVGNALAPLPTVMARELAQRGVLCICLTSLSSEFYNELPELIFSSLPTINEYAINSAEYAAKKLKRDVAALAGPGTNTKQRVYCLYYIDGQGTKVDPEGARARDIFIREWGKWGLTFKTIQSYRYDPGSNQNDITNNIAKFKADGCTTIIPVVDPIQPILITKEATKQNYYPEWFIVGTGLSDTTTINRFYDQGQVAHAFGISPLWVTWSTVEASAGFREFHHAMPGMRKGDEGVLINIYRGNPDLIFRAIHMAGPNLNNKSFAAGLHAYPRTGGKPASPLVFFTRQYPTAVKDWSEIWYDPTLVGPDERSETGQGMMVRADGGRRYTPGNWPAGPPSRKNAVTTTDNQNNPSHEQDGHTHEKRCLSCAS